MTKKDYDVLMDDYYSLAIHLDFYDKDKAANILLNTGRMDNRKTEPEILKISEADEKELLNIFDRTIEKITEVK